MSLAGGPESGCGWRAVEASRIVWLSREDGTEVREVDPEVGSGGVISFFSTDGTTAVLVPLSDQRGRGVAWEEDGPLMFVLWWGKIKVEPGEGSLECKISSWVTQWCS